MLQQFILLKWMNARDRQCSLLKLILRMALGDGSTRSVHWKTTCPESIIYLHKTK